MMPAAPAEASRLMPYWRTLSKVISAAPIAVNQMAKPATRCRMWSWVTCLRARNSSVAPVLKRRL